MTRNTEIARAVRYAILMGAATVAAATTLPVQAQVVATDQSAENMTTIVVTGTRIVIPGVESASPITTVGSAEIARENATNIEEVLHMLPANFGGDNPAANNGSAGVTTVNLRGLGPNRNLVLMDGKRMQPYNINGFVDISSVPVALLERVDIVTGGASAVYGSDAMSGVVNFIMKKNFEGVQFNATASETGAQDGKQYDTQITMGSNVADNRGNVVLNIDFTHRQPVFQGSRTYGFANINSQSGASSAAEGGSFTTSPTLIFGNISGYQIQDNGNLNNVFDASGNATPAFKSFNFNPYNLYQTPEERYTAMGMGTFEINSHAEAYAKFMFANIAVDTVLAPSGTFGFVWNLPMANPFLNTQAQGVLCTDAGLTPGTPACTNAVLPESFYRRTVEIGPRITDYQNNSFQFVAGMRGTIVGDWTYDASYQRGRTTRTIEEFNDINGPSIQEALLTTSATSCTPPGGTAATDGCVPLNLFGPNGSITPAQAAFVRLNLLINEFYTQDVTTGSISGNLGALKSPWTDKPIGVAFGGEYRKEQGNVNPDSNVANPNIPVGFGQTVGVAGAYSVKEGFLEVLAPVVSNAPFAYAADIDAGYRHSSYDLAGQTTTYKIGADWAPIKEVRFRAEFQRAVRAPNISELFSPVAFGTGNLAVDPCAGTGPVGNAGLSALCVATGAPAARVAAGTISPPIAGQVNNFSGGNINLKPEIGDTYTYGVVFNGLGWGPIQHPFATLDYYRIDITNAISTPSLPDVVDGCYSAALNPGYTNNALCALIKRNTLTGNLQGGPTSGVFTLEANLAFLKVSGFELQAGFDVDLSAAGKLEFALDSNYYLHNDFANSPTSPLNECVGEYGASCGTQTGGPVSRVRFTQRTTWVEGPWEVGYFWRYASAVHTEPTEIVLPQFASIPAYNWLDLEAAFNVTKKTSVRFGITNLFNKDPPFVGGSAADTVSNSGNTFPGGYDSLGRVYSIGVQVGF